MSIQNPHLFGDQAQAPGEQARLKRLAVIASVSVASVLILSKLWAYLASDSVAMLSSLMDSSFDLLASLVAMFGVYRAAEPADRQHRYGHGKAEAIASLGQAFFIGGSALFLAVETVRRLVDPQIVRNSLDGVGVMVVSIVLTLLLLTFQNYVVRKTASVAVTADRLHYAADLAMNLAVIAALLLTHYTAWPYFDPLFAGVIAVALLRGAWKVARQSTDILMDSELPEQDRERILALVRKHPDVRAVHDLRTRSSGTQVFIEFHLEMDGAMALRRAHDVTEDIERILYDAFPTAEVLIHQEPVGIDDYRIDHNIS